MAIPSAPTLSAFPPIASDGISLLWLKAIPLVPETPLAHAVSSTIPLFLFLLPSIFLLSTVTIPLVYKQNCYNFYHLKTMNKTFPWFHIPSSCSSLLQSSFKVFLYLVPPIFPRFSWAHCNIIRLLPSTTTPLKVSLIKDTNKLLLTKSFVKSWTNQLLWKTSILCFLD